MRLIATLLLALMLGGCSSWFGTSRLPAPAKPVAAAPAKPYQDRVPRDPKSPDVLVPPPVAGSPPPLIAITPPSITVAPTPRTPEQIKADCKEKAKTMNFGIHFWKKHKWIAMCRKQAAGT